MKHLKYKVIVNNENTQPKEYLFKTMKEVCLFLGISYGTLYSLRSKRLKCKHASKLHLKNIQVIKIDYDKSHYQKKKSINPIDYINTLDEKYALI